MRRRRSHPKDKLPTVPTLLILAAALPLFFGAYWPGVTIAAAWIAGNLLRELARRQQLRRLMKRLPAIRMDEWTAWTTASNPYRHLYYALRVSQVVPTLTSVKTLASRWSVAHSGAGGAGLLAAPSSRMKDEVTRFLSSLFLDRLRHLLADLVTSAVRRAAESRSGESRRRIIARAIDKIAHLQSEFAHPLPGADDAFAHAIDYLQTAVEFRP